MATVSDNVIKNIIKHVLFKEDYRIEIVTLINSNFLDFAINFFKEIVSAKLRNKSITIDWYKKEFLNDKLPSDELIINSGLNRKTISNMYNSASREVVLTATKEHYALLYEAISNLVEENNEIDIMLTLKYQGVSVDLNINESLIVINVLAVKRAQLRGGSWSSAGKRTEKLLMLTLCQLYQIPRTNYDLTGLTKENREVDFYFISRSKTRYQCEVKLMGKGNPESADGTYNARDSHIFVGDFLSDLVKTQLDSNNIKWIELRRNEGFKKLPSILKDLDIPYVDFTEELTESKVFEVVSNLLDKIPEDIEDQSEFSLED